MQQRRFLSPKERSIRRLAASQFVTVSEAAAARANSRRHRLEPLKADEVLYFAFGSNMNPTVLTGRRMVQPRQSLPCFVPDHQLSFGVQGLPYAEPGFATIVKLPQQHQQQRQQQQEHSPTPQQQKQQQRRRHHKGAGSAVPCVHGVLHRITQREWERVKATEGVGNKSIGYQVITVDCHLYDGNTVVRALTLQSADASMHNTTRLVSPSQRYLSLLQEGAQHHKLDRQYQEWLATLPAYQPNSIQQMVGAAASGAVLLAAAAPAVPVYVACRAMGLVQGPEPSRRNLLLRQKRSTAGGMVPSKSSSDSDNSNRDGPDTRQSDSGGLKPFMSWYMNQAQNWTWFVHDTALAPVLGSGCSNINSDDATEHR